MPMFKCKKTLIMYETWEWNMETAFIAGKEYQGRVSEGMVHLINEHGDCQSMDTQEWMPEYFEPY